MRYFSIFQVKPLMSIDNHEARLRVLALYKAWIRQVPAMKKMYDIPVTEQNCRDTIKASFVKNKNLKDIRVIDMMVIKVESELIVLTKLNSLKSKIYCFLGSTRSPWSYWMLGSERSYHVQILQRDYWRKA